MTIDKKIEQILKELATQNFNACPEDYQLTDGLASEEVTNSVTDLAKYYYKNRNEEEIERDEKAGVWMIQYVEIVHSAFAEWIDNQKS